LRESWFPQAGTRRPRPDQNFNTTLERDLDQAIAPIELAPQDMARRWLSLLGDAFMPSASAPAEPGILTRSLPSG